MKADSSKAKNFIDLMLDKRTETHEPKGVREKNEHKATTSVIIKGYKEMFRVIKSIPYYFNFFNLWCICKGEEEQGILK